MRAAGLWKWPEHFYLGSAAEIQKRKHHFSRTMLYARGEGLWGPYEKKTEFAWMQNTSARSFL